MPFLAETLSAADAIRQTETWGWPADDRVADNAWHFLHHFRADEDIRARDERYAELQRERMVRYAAELRGQD
jgi:hypothetical protein